MWRGSGTRSVAQLGAERLIERSERLVASLGKFAKLDKEFFELESSARVQLLQAIIELSVWKYVVWNQKRLVGWMTLRLKKMNDSRPQIASQ